MKNVFKIALLCLVSSSILCAELNMLDYFNADIAIELTDFHEEGSGEKDGQENSEEELEVEYSFHLGHSQDVFNTADNTENYLYRLNLVQVIRDITIPPPEHK